MHYQEIMTKGNYSLVLRKNALDEYAVVHGLNNETKSWNHTVAYWNFGEYALLDQAKALSAAIECFRAKTEENFISKYILEEIATKSLHAMKQWEEDTSVVYFEEELDLEDFEREYFGLNENADGVDAEEENNFNNLMDTFYEEE